MSEIPELKERVDTLIGGVQIQNRYKGKGIGTLACIVYDNETGAPLGLTNRHILKGDIGSTVIQPHGQPRTEEFIVGRVLRKGGKGKSRDCAVFTLNLENRKFDTENSIYGLSGKVTEHVEPVKGLKVKKVGQRTGLTYGIVSKIYTNGNFQVKPNRDREKVKEISYGGDSGALWVTDEDDFKAVGLHRAGEKKKRKPDRAYAIPISRVLEMLNVRF